MPYIKKNKDNVSLIHSYISSGSSCSTNTHTIDSFFLQQQDTHPQQQQDTQQQQQQDTHPQQQDTHPQQQDTHPQQQDTHPQQQDTHPQQQDTHPQQQDTHPQQQHDTQHTLPSHISSINISLNQYTNKCVVVKRDDILNNLSNHNIKFSLIDIKKKINTLTLDELKEIFKIILSNNEKYSNNKNGIFINLNTLKKSTIQAISDFLYFSDNNKTLDEIEEYERAKYKDIIINN